MRLLKTQQSLTERVYAAILDDIVDGALAPGQHLVQEQLAEMLGVSRQPVQQAMALLKADGLVEEIGTRGLRVATLDVDRMRNHYEIRALLDAYGARKAALRVASGDMPLATIERRAERILAAGFSAIDGGSVRDQIRHDETLHEFIYEASGNPVLSASAEVHWRYLRRAMGDVVRRAEPAREIWEQHAAILGAILKGDAARAETLAREHVARAAELLAASLAQRAADPATARN